MNEMRENFRKYLIAQGYKVYTPKGLPSTVWEYIKSIDRVCEWENMSWEDVKNNIEDLEDEYSPYGAKAAKGALSHCTVINALRRFKEFVGKWYR